MQTAGKQLHIHRTNPRLSTAQFEKPFSKSNTRHLCQPTTPTPWTNTISRDLNQYTDCSLLSFWSSRTLQFHRIAQTCVLGTWFGWVEWTNSNMLHFCRVLVFLFVLYIFCPIFCVVFPYFPAVEWYTDFYFTRDALVSNACVSVYAYVIQNRKCLFGWCAIWCSRSYTCPYCLSARARGAGELRHWKQV